jgi:hypothetical protein
MKIINLILLGFVFFLITFTQAFSCDVPVCDIAGTIATLEKSSVESRATFLGDLYQKTKSLNNVLTLRNLHEFSKLSYELQKKLQDPDNIVAWSVFLRENSIYGLLKFAPFDVEDMKSLYQETFEFADLTIDRQLRIRFDVFERWKAQIGTIMDTKVVYNLYDFISFAQRESENAKDEEYVLREAVFVLDLLGKRLSYLYPSYEGVFEIKTSCVPDPDSCGSVDLSADRLTMLNSITDLGIFGAIYNSHNSALSYMFYRSVIESFGTRIYTLSEILATTGRPSELYVQLLNDKQDIAGYVVSPRYTGSLHYEGKIIYSPLKFYGDEGLENEKPVITGKFEGLFGDKKAVIIIRQKKNKALMASMVAGCVGDGLSFDFTTGEYVSHRGIINLVGFPLQKTEPYKLNLAYRKDANGIYRWSGGFFTITGKFEKVEFVRSADIDQPNPDDLKIESTMRVMLK